MADYTTDLLDDYDKIRESRDWDHETQAENIARMDKALAAAYRERFCASADEPVGRNGKPETAAQKKKREAVEKKAAEEAAEAEAKAAAEAAAKAAENGGDPTPPAGD